MTFPPLRSVMSDPPPTSFDDDPGLFFFFFGFLGFYPSCDVNARISLKLFDSFFPSFFQRLAPQALPPPLKGSVSAYAGLPICHFPRPHFFLKPLPASSPVKKTSHKICPHPRFFSSPRFDLRPDFIVRPFSMARKPSFGDPPPLRFFFFFPFLDLLGPCRRPLPIAEAPPLCKRKVFFSLLACGTHFINGFLSLPRWFFWLRFVEF